jgi:hypothetical protein
MTLVPLPTRRRGVALRGLVLLALVSAACATPTPRSGDTLGSRAAARVDDTTRLATLEREARALAKTTGCDAASSCRTAPVGWRGCGGPRSYVVYCPASTDTAALLRKLEELKRAEMEYVDREGIVSTCEMRMPPGVTSQGGRCVATR